MFACDGYVDCIFVGEMQESVLLILACIENMVHPEIVSMSDSVGMYGHTRSCLQVTLIVILFMGMLIENAWR